MSATGVLFIVAALFIGYEGIKHFRVKTASASTGASSSSSDSTGNAAGGAVGGALTGEPSSATTPPISQPSNAATTSNPQSVGSVAYNVVAVWNWFKARGVDPTAFIALMFGESAGLSHNTNTTDPGGSYGPLQINMSAHPEVSPAQAEDINFALNYWGPHLLAVYQSMGGDAAWHANPGGFLSSFWPTAQVSVQPTQSQIVQAISDMRKWLSILGL